MTTEELEEKLEGGTETQTIEFKEACEWDEKIFAKDILVLSNVQDGGYIIIGVKELNNGTFEREGISATQKASYKIDEMKDQLTKYADPHVNFIVNFPKDRNGKEYAVIRVFQFEEVPVEAGETVQICGGIKTRVKVAGLTSHILREAILLRLKQLIKEKLIASNYSCSRSFLKHTDYVVDENNSEQIQNHKVQKQ